VTQFEFVTVMLSIVLALSIARCLDALPASFDPGRRYWVHFTWTLVKLTNPVSYWWAMWAFRHREAWSFPLFFGSLVVAGILYLQIVALATTDPQSVRDWRSHYYSKHRLFFGVDVLLAVLIGVGVPVLMEAPLVNPTSLVVAPIAGMSTAAALSSSPRLHAAYAVFAAVITVCGTFALMTVGTFAAS